MPIQSGMVAPTANDPASIVEAVRSIHLLLLAVQRDVQYLAKELGVVLPSQQRR